MEPVKGRNRKTQPMARTTTPRGAEIPQTTPQEANWNKCRRRMKWRATHHWPRENAGDHPTHPSLGHPLVLPALKRTPLPLPPPRRRPSGRATQPRHRLRHRLDGKIHATSSRHMEKGDQHSDPCETTPHAMTMNEPLRPTEGAHGVHRTQERGSTQQTSATA